MLSTSRLYSLLGAETTRYLNCYKGESPFAVVRRAVKMMCMADGHLTPNGRVKTAHDRTRGKS